MKLRSRKNAKNSTESTSKNWDGLFKAVTTLVAVSGFVFGVYQYYVNNQRQKENAKEELRRALEKKQLDLYLTSIQVASEFAQESQPNDAEQKRKQLIGLFAQIDPKRDPPVAAVSKKFCGALKGWVNLNTPPADFSPPYRFTYTPDDPTEGGATTFEELASDLSQAMQATLRKITSDQAATEQIQRRLRRTPTDQLAVAWKF